MYVDNTLFFLILAAVTLIIIVLFAVVANLLNESMQKRKLRLKRIAATVKQTPHECAHFFGYLSSHTRDQPIPNECFGCLLAIDCIKANPQAIKSARAST